MPHLLYADGIIHCPRCGGQLTGGKVLKKTTGKEYVYYHCAIYNSDDHPHVRLTAQKIDEQVSALLGRMKQQDTVRDWFTREIRK